MSSERLQRIADYVQRQVDQCQAPMMQVAVMRHGTLVFETAAGLADLERRTPLSDDTIMRIYSMTKPIVSTAFMILVERAEVQLDHPVSRYLPCFANMTVHTGEGVRPARTPITLQHLLTHSSGIGYEFLQPPGSAVAESFHAAGVGFNPSLPGRGEPGALRREVERLAAVPLICEPGTAFHYGYGIDVIGCVIEIITGQLLGDFLKKEIFEPLGMHDTGFHVPPADVGRFAACYQLRQSGSGFEPGVPTQDFTVPCPHMSLGGSGLVSTMRDFRRFTAMLAGGGVCPPTGLGSASRRLLSRTTDNFMMLDHLPPGVDVTPGFLHNRHGVGFGIGGSVVKSAARNGVVGATYSWGNMANGYMCIDPSEGIAFVMLTQVMPSFRLCHWRRELQSLIQAAIDD